MVINGFIVKTGVWNLAGILIMNSGYTVKKTKKTEFGLWVFTVPLLINADHVFSALDEPTILKEYSLLLWILITLYICTNKLSGRLLRWSD